MPDEQLEEQFFPTQAALLQRRLPWLRLARGFRIAVGPRPMLFALLAVVVWSAGDWVLSWLPWSPQSIGRELAGETLPRALWPWEVAGFPNTPATRTRVNLADAIHAPGETLQRATTNGRAVLWPMERLIFSASRIVAPRGTLGEWLHAWLVVLWGLAVSSFFGGTLVRMAALEFVHRSEASLRSALEYVVPRWPNLVAAPLATVGGLGFFWLMNFFVGLIASIPVAGETVVAILWFLPLLFGLVMAVIVIGVAAGWPFMFCTVCIDGGDTFEALSRAFSYLINRPWYALFLALLTMLYGSVLLYFVTGVLTLAVDLTAYSAGSGLMSAPASQLFVDSPPQPPFSYWQDWPVPGEHFLTPFTRQTIGLWFRLLASVPAAFLFSFFWTSTAIVYLLLRHREDAIPLDEVDSGEPARSGPALFGIAAAERREAQQDAPPPASDAGTRRPETP